MSKKFALFSFSGDLTCFAHVLLNAKDLYEKGYGVKVIIEGQSTGLLKDLTLPGRPFTNLFEKIKELGILDSVCRACAAKMNTLVVAEEQGLKLSGEMSGHPSISRFIEEGYQVLIF